MKRNQVATFRRATNAPDFFGNLVDIEKDPINHTDGGFLKWGYPKIDGFCEGESHLEKDDLGVSLV